MNRRSKILLIATIALLVGFIWGLRALFDLRFKSGDIYPAYSSLRSDPLGTKVVYQSLAEIPALDVSRNHEPFEKIETQPGTTMFLVGAEDVDRGGRALPDRPDDPNAPNEPSLFLWV